MRDPSYVRRKQPPPRSHYCKLAYFFSLNTFTFCLKEHNSSCWLFQNIKVTYYKRERQAEAPGGLSLSLFDIRLIRKTRSDFPSCCQSITLTLRLHTLPASHKSSFLH